MGNTCCKTNTINETGPHNEMRLDTNNSENKNLPTLKSLENDMKNIYKEVQEELVELNDKIEHKLQKTSRSKNSRQGKTKTTINTMNAIRTKTLTHKNRTSSIDVHNSVIQEINEEYFDDKEILSKKILNDEKKKKIGKSLQEDSNVSVDSKEAKMSIEEAQGCSRDPDIENTGNIDIYAKLIIEKKIAPQSYASDLSLGISGGNGPSSAYSSKKMHPYAASIKSGFGNQAEESSKSRFGSIFAKAHYKR